MLSGGPEEGDDGERESGRDSKGCWADPGDGESLEEVEASSSSTH